MKRLITILFFVLSSTGAMAQQDLEQSLKSSAWQGTYEVFETKNTIRIAFLAYLDAAGQLLYFHRLGKGFVSEVVGPLDGPCEFTPRGLQVDTTPAVIHSYHCVNNASDESQEEVDPYRHAAVSLPVKNVSLSEDGTQLEILVSIAGIDVHYVLLRQSVDASVLQSSQSARSWVDGISQ